MCATVFYCKSCALILAKNMQVGLHFSSNSSGHPDGMLPLYISLIRSSTDDVTKIGVY
jgi:fibronectin type 3 domain-containing protein